MKAIKCDRCGKYIDDLNTPSIRYTRSQDAEYELHLDVCPECLEDFLKFMRNQEK